MFKSYKKIIGYVTHLKTSRILLALMNNGFLKDMGWINSERSGLQVDEDNNPIPWCTYSYIDFITPFLTNKKTMFEYGAGNSTLFYAPKVKEVISIDHDKNWITALKERALENVTLSHFDLDSGYTTSIGSYDMLFDFIIVDGRKRVECIKNSFDKVTNNGVIILDDSERKKYQEGVRFLKEKGFKKIDFWGIAPGYIHNKCTTVFCKDFNSFLS